LVVENRDVRDLLTQGMALHQRGQLSEAQVCYQQVLAIDSDHIDALHLLGVVKGQLGQAEESLHLIRRVVEKAPRAPLVLMNYGNALRALYRSEEALASYDRALALKPDYVDVWVNKGNLLLELGRYTQALASYDKALAISPNLAAAWNNRGRTLSKLNRHQEAAENYRSAIALKPDHAEAYYNLGNLLTFLGAREEAAAALDRAISLRPHWAAAHLSRCLTELPVLYEEEAEIERQRDRYADQLKRLAGEAGRLSHSLEHGIVTPFFLAYQGRNDHELQSVYGSVVCRIMARHAPPPERLAKPPSADEPVRIGFATAFFYNHSVWKIPVKGWVSQLDRRRFRLFGYHLSAMQDAETAKAKAMFERFVQGPLSPALWRETILNDQVHVLIYPELGMDETAACLAAIRLAPVQCNGMAHPVTSGYPTVDYTLSSDFMEPADAQSHYSERLVRLPNLSIYYEPIVAAPRTTSRPQLGLRPSATVFWCAQTLIKYLPQYDDVFPRIARQVPDSQFVFIELAEHKDMNVKFQHRLARAFASFGLPSQDYIVLLPHLLFEEFLAAIGQCDIVLNSIGWSGFNSLMESLTHNLPVVAMCGPSMRSRHGAAILRMMDVTETLTETIDDYVATAVRLARDPVWRAAIKEKIARNKHRLYRDRTCIEALEDFLERTARGLASS
jgi:predicted O-linked N-acetylglucosamine transferase (SPINDLY family)